MIKILLILLLLLYINPVLLYRMKFNHHLFTTRRCLFEDDNLNIHQWERAKSPTLEALFDRDGVKYLDPNKANPSSSSSTTSNTSNNTNKSKKNLKIIPLMPFENPLFIGSREFLYIYEMRFRSLMNHVESHDDILGRCYLTENGDIGAIGSLCKIVEKKKVEDGKGFFIIESTSRIRIHRIIQTEPYILAEVELDYNDNKIDNKSEIILCENLCYDVYNLLKIYLRIHKYHRQQQHHMYDQSTTSTSTSSTQQNVLFQPAVHRNRPQPDLREADKGVARHIAFSHACANLLSTEPAILQQIFQNRLISYRLHGIKRILAEAIDELSSLLIDDGALTIHAVADIVVQSTSPTDDDADLVPPEGYQEVTLNDTDFDVDKFSESLNDHLHSDHVHGDEPFHHHHALDGSHSPYDYATNNYCDYSELDAHALQGPEFDSDGEHFSEGLPGLDPWLDEGEWEWDDEEATFQ